MKNSCCPVILSSVLLSFFVSISSGGVQGQSFGTCITTDPIDGVANPFYNSQTIYSLLCLTRQAILPPATEPNTITTISPYPNFSTLCTLLNQTSEVKNLLNNTSSRLTFFAPANAAFVGVNTASFTPAQIRAILQTHILPNPKLTTDLPCGECQCTMEGAGITNLCRTRTRTVCTTAGSAFQVGGGNTGPGGVQEFPRIGQPLDASTAFENQVNTGDTNKPWGAGNDNIILSNNQGYFSENAVACNGIIHAVNKIIMPGVGGNQQCGGYGGKGSKGGKGGGYYLGGKGSGYYFGGKGSGYYGGGVEEVIVVNGNGGGFVEFVGFGRYGGKGYGGKGRKGYYGRRRQLEMEDTFFDDEDEDEVVIEGKEEEESSVVPPQNHNTGSSSSSSTSTFQERSQRRKRFLESLITPNGEIEPLE